MLAQTIRLGIFAISTAKLVLNEVLPRLITSLIDST